MWKKLAVLIVIVCLSAVGCRSSNEAPPAKVGEKPEARVEKRVGTQMDCPAVVGLTEGIEPIPTER